MKSYLLDIDDICREKIERLVKQMAEQENINEELKARNQLEWNGKMNNIKARAEAIGGCLLRRVVCMIWSR